MYPRVLNACVSLSIMLNLTSHDLPISLDRKKNGPLLCNIFLIYFVIIQQSGMLGCKGEGNTAREGKNSCVGGSGVWKVVRAVLQRQREACSTIKNVAAARKGGTGQN